MIMLLRLSTLALLATAVTAQSQQCMTQDFTLSTCLDSAGVSDAQQADCVACIVGVANNPVIKGAISNFCSVADAAACESIVEDCTACGTCTSPAIDLGQCEIDVARSEQIEAAMHLVPDDVVQMCTASGSPAEVKAKVREYVDNGATCPILYPLGDAKLMIDTFADGWSE